MENSYAFGSAAASSLADGICSDNAGRLIHCYAVVFVNCWTNAGGIASSAGLGVISCYYNSQIAMKWDNDGRGYPRTTAQMTYPHDDATTYMDWAFDDIWYISQESNEGYPSFLEVQYIDSG